jgi:hypothetical protein
MGSYLNYTFGAQLDDFSNQIFCDQDPKFWFRLEGTNTLDNITDFFLGGFDPALGGDLLILCYRTLNREPKDRIVFRDIFSSRSVDAATIKSVSKSLEVYAKQLLASYGRSMRRAHVDLWRGKVNFVIEVRQPS